MKQVEESVRYNIKANIILSFVLIGVIITFAYNYNNYVRTVFNEASVHNGYIIGEYNSKITKKLTAVESDKQWFSIAEEYDDLAIEIENSSNVIVVETIGESFREPAIRNSTVFEYQGQVYTLKTSMYIFKDYISGISTASLNFMIIQFIWGVAFLCLLVFAIYNFTLKNYKILYEYIEEYEKTGELRRTNLKGYAGRIYRRFCSMTENLERQQENQKNMIAAISHDIKTPLTSIMGYAERLSKDNISDERRERYIDTVYGKSLEIRELVDEFDEFISFNLTKEMDIEVIGARYIEKQLSEDFGADLDLEGVELTVNNSAGNAKISVNKKKMRRVFSNIFANSVKHFTSDDKKIVVDIHSDRNKLYIKVSDNGRGVCEEELERIFQPLYTSDGGRKMAGLGLSICREIINSHGGKIYAAKSELGGLSICIELERCDVPKYL